MSEPLLFQSALQKGPCVSQEPSALDGGGYHDKFIWGTACSKCSSWIHSFVSHSHPIKQTPSFPLPKDGKIELQTAKPSVCSTKITQGGSRDSGIHTGILLQSPPLDALLRRYIVCSIKWVLTRVVIEWGEGSCQSLVLGFILPDSLGRMR